MIIKKQDHMYWEMYFQTLFAQIKKMTAQLQRCETVTYGCKAKN